MFGKMGDMMGMMSKLNEAKKKLEETKKRLDSETIEEQSADGNILVQVTISGKINDLQIKNTEVEKLALAIKDTLNIALEKAKTQYENELAKDAMEGMPDISNFMK